MLVPSPQTYLELGLERLELEKPRKIIILDPGHPDFQQTAIYRHMDGGPRDTDNMYMIIQTGQLVRVLQGCVPYSASDIRAILQVTATRLSSMTFACMAAQSQKVPLPWSNTQDGVKRSLQLAL